jgi:hypothetical protein
MAEPREFRAPSAVSGTLVDLCQAQQVGPFTVVVSSDDTLIKPGTQVMIQMSGTTQEFCFTSASGFQQPAAQCTEPGVWEGQTTIGDAPYYFQVSYFAPSPRLYGVFIAQTTEGLPGASEPIGVWGSEDEGPADEKPS